MKRLTSQTGNICKLLVVLGLMLTGCAGLVVKTCPGGNRLVTIDKSDINNAYLARMSEEARALAKCAKLDIEDSLEDEE